MTLLSIPFQTDFTRRPVNSAPEPALSAELCRVLQAAVVNKTFRHNLLENPLRTVEGGYCGEQFNLGAEDRRSLADVRASTLEDFTNQLMADSQPVMIPRMGCVIDRPIS